MTPRTSNLTRSRRPLRAIWLVAVAMTMGVLASCEVIGGPVELLISDNAQEVVAENPPGTIYLLESGTYVGLHLVPKPGDSFIGQPDGSTVLDGLGSPAAAFRAVDAADDGTIVGGTIPDVTISNITFTNYAPNSFNSIVDAASELDYEGGGPDWAPATNWTMTNLVFEGNTGDGASPAIEVGSGSTLSDVTIIGNPGPGIAGHGHDILIENSTVLDSAFDADGGGFWHAGGIKLVTVQDTIIRDSTVSGNTGPGIWIDIDGDNVEISGNTVENNGFSGIYYEISRGATIADNIVNGNGFDDLTDSEPAGRGWLFPGGITIATSNNNTITGNQLNGNAAGITLLDQRTLRLDDLGTRPNFGTLYEDDGVTELEWRTENNIVTGNHTVNSGITGVSAAEDESVNSTIYATTTFQGNTYEGPDNLFSWLYDAEAEPWLTDSYGAHQTLWQWQNVHGNDVEPSS